MHYPTILLGLVASVSALALPRGNVENNARRAATPVDINPPGLTPMERWVEEPWAAANAQYIGQVCEAEGSFFEPTYLSLNEWRDMDDKRKSSTYNWGDGNRHPVLICRNGILVKEWWYHNYNAEDPHHGGFNGDYPN